MSQMLLSSKQIIYRDPDVAWRKVGEYTLAITPSNNAVHRLNGTGSYVWEALGEKGDSAESLAKSMASLYMVDEEKALSDVLNWASEAHQQGLVTLA